MNTLTALEQQLATPEQRSGAINKIKDLLENYPYEQFLVEAEEDVLDFSSAFVALLLELDSANSTIISMHPSNNS